MFLTGNDRVNLNVVNLVSPVTLYIDGLKSLWLYSAQYYFGITWEFSIHILVS